MSSDGKVHPDSMAMAVELAKAGMAMQVVNSGPLLLHPEKVATFIEVVAKKIDEIRRQ